MTERTDGPSAAARMRVMKRDRFRCTYCGVSGNDAELEIDHIIAASKGGSNHISNLTTSCRDCNQRKGAGDAPLREPAAEREELPRGLIGLFIWTLIPSDEAAHQHYRGSVPPGFEPQYQGHIIGLHDDYALVRLFSALDGAPTLVRPIPISEVLSKRCCVLFATNEDMLWQAEKYGRLEQ